MFSDLRAIILAIRVRHELGVHAVVACGLMMRQASSVRQPRWQPTWRQAHSERGWSVFILHYTALPFSSL